MIQTVFDDRSLYVLHYESPAKTSWNHFSICISPISFFLLWYTVVVTSYFRILPILFIDPIVCSLFSSHDLSSSMSHLVIDVRASVVVHRCAFITKRRSRKDLGSAHFPLAIFPLPVFSLSSCSLPLWTLALCRRDSNLLPLYFEIDVVSFSHTKKHSVCEVGRI